MAVQRGGSRSVGARVDDSHSIKVASAGMVVVLAILAAGCPQKREVPAAAAGEKRTALTSVPPASSGSASPAAGPVEVGSMMPAYTATRLDGKRFDLAAERGKVRFVNLWATWCAPCRSEIPELQSLHDKYASRGFEVIGISMDESGADSVKAFVTQHKMTYPVALDPNGQIADLLGTSVLPTSVVLDRQGKVIWKQFGIVSMKDAVLQKALEKALAGT